VLTSGFGLSSAMPGTLRDRLGKPLFADKIRVGAIGINGMGWSVLSSMLKSNPDVTCTALCDVDGNVLSKRASELEKNFGSKATTYGDHRKLLDDRNVDAVIIGTPDHWHCLQMVDAVQAGKHVYVEKPAGNSIEEVRIMVAAQKKYNRAVQVGQWQRSNAHFRSALEFLQSGKLGRIRMVKTWAYQGWMKNIPVKPDAPVPAGVDYQRWLGPAPTRAFNPNRFHFNFRWFWDYAGGLMTDWGVHLVDYALLGMNAKDPLTVMATGGKMAFPDDASETPDTLATVYDFGDFVMLWEHATTISNGNYGKDHGIAYIGNNGTLVLDRGGWKVIPEGKSMEPVEEVKKSDDGLANHTRNFINAVKTGDYGQLAAPIEAGATVAEVCQMGNIAYKTGKKLKWNKTDRSFDDPAANKLIKPVYQNNYKLPKI
jgi:predicted dehydrogenase